MTTLREIIEIGQQLTDAPDVYIEAAAYWSLSSTLGKYVVIPYYPSPPDRPVRPSLWIIVAGLPGIMRKSTVIESLGKNLVKAALREYYRQVAPNLTPEQVNEQIALMFIETGSYEGIVKHITEHQQTVDTFYLASAEWGGVLQTMKKREYMVGFASLLSKLYSGEEHVVRLVRETRYIRGGLYVTALLGMQEPWLYLDNMIFRQGLMRRTLLIYAEPQDKTRWLPPLSLQRMQLLDRLAEIGQQLASKMITFSEYAPIEARFTAPAYEKINEYARNLEQEIINSGTTSNWVLYSQNLWDHVTRLAVVTALDRAEAPRDTPAGPAIMVELQDVEQAIRFVESTLPGAKKAISLTGVPVKPREIKVATEAEEVVKRIIEKYACNGASTSALLKETKMLKDELKRLVLNLVEKEEVYAFVVKTRGRPRINFVVKSQRHCFETHVPKAQAVSAEALKNLW